MIQYLLGDVFAERIVAENGIVLSEDYAVEKHTQTDKKRNFNLDALKFSKKFKNQIEIRFHLVNAFVNQITN